MIDDKALEDVLVEDGWVLASNNFPSPFLPVRLFMRGDRLYVANKSAVVPAGDYFKFWGSVVAFKPMQLKESFQ